MKPLTRRSVTARRARLVDAIEKAIALLDQLDGDPDLEPSLSDVWNSGRSIYPGGYDLEHEDRARPPKGYMRPGDLGPGNSLGLAQRVR